MCVPEPLERQSFLIVGGNNRHFFFQSAHAGAVVFPSSNLSRHIADTPHVSRVQEIDDDEAEEEAAALERVRSKNPNAPQGRPAVQNNEVRFHYAPHVPLRP